MLAIGRIGWLWPTALLALLAGCASARNEHVAPIEPAPAAQVPAPLGNLQRLPPVRQPGRASEVNFAGGAQAVREAASGVQQAAHRTEFASSQIVPARSRDAEEIPPPRALAPGLTINQAIATTLQNDPVLRAGFQDIRQANADWVTSALLPNPNVEVAQALMALGTPFAPIVAEGGPPQLDVIVGFPIDWYLFGKRAAAMLTAARGVRANQSDYANLVRERVLETAEAFYDVLELQSLLDVAHQDVDNLQRVEALTRIAVDAHARPRVELNRVLLDLLNSQQTLRDTERALVTARARLRARMGEIGADPTFEVGGALEAPLATPAPPVEESLAIAEANRPDIAALRWRVAEARADITLRRREAYPETVPQFIISHQFQEQAIAMSDATSWGAGINVDMPLFNRNQGNRAKATAALIQNDYLLRAGLVELRSEIVAVTAELETARANAQATADQQLRVAEEVRASINQAYEAGARPLIDVLDAQRNYRETFRNYITSRADYWRAVYRFHAALGRTMLE